jgi:hypothetical protein
MRLRVQTSTIKTKKKSKKGRDYKYLRLSSYCEIAFQIGTPSLCLKLFCHH